MKTINLRICRTAPTHVGWFLFLDPDGEPEDKGGWTSAGPRDAASPDSWLALAKRRVKLPSAVRAVRQTWKNATITPLGWEDQPGHAPDGILLTWSIP